MEYIYIGWKAEQASLIPQLAKLEDHGFIESTKIDMQGNGLVCELEIERSDE